MKPSVILKLILGVIALFFAVVGVVLPLLPTTPFVLLALGCFSTMPKVQQKILKISFFREYYWSYKEKRGLKPATVLVSLSFLWGMLAISALAAQKTVVTIILAIVGTCVTIHILCIARLRKQREDALQGKSNEPE